jgi:hypothetical protein
MRGKDITPFAMGGAGYCLDARAAAALGAINLPAQCARLDKLHRSSSGGGTAHARLCKAVAAAPPGVTRWSYPTT